jgi:hypothetical protein
MRTVEIFLRMGMGEQWSMMEGMNLTKIYCRHFCICHNTMYPQYNNNIKKLVVGHLWLMAVILATQEAEIKKIVVQSQTQANSL